MFEGIEDSSDDDSLHSIEGPGDEGQDSVAGRIEVEGQEVGRHSPEKFASPEKEDLDIGVDQKEPSGQGERKVAM